MLPGRIACQVVFAFGAVTGAPRAAGFEVLMNLERAARGVVIADFVVFDLIALCFVPACIGQPQAALAIHRAVVLPGNVRVDGGRVGVINRQVAVHPVVGVTGRDVSGVGLGLQVAVGEIAVGNRLLTVSRDGAGERRQIGVDVLLGISQLHLAIPYRLHQLSVSAVIPKDAFFLNRSILQSNPIKLVG